MMPRDTAPRGREIWATVGIGIGHSLVSMLYFVKSL